MAALAPYFGDVVQVALAVLALVLVVISANSYRLRRDGRYLLLLVAFTSLFLVATWDLTIGLLASVSPALMAPFELYVIPSAEVLMIVSFIAALLWSPAAGRRSVYVVLAACVCVAVILSALLLAGGTTGAAQAALPSGCVKPYGGFLIIASELGYNDSLAHGAPAVSWPVLEITQGSDVKITVCNTYSQTVGFQVQHYLQSKIETVPPDRVINVSFVANESGTFSIYCATFSAIHLYLQGGKLDVV